MLILVALLTAPLLADAPQKRAITENQDRIYWGPGDVESHPEPDTVGRRGFPRGATRRSGSTSPRTTDLGACGGATQVGLVRPVGFVTVRRSERTSANAPSVSSPAVFFSVVAVRLADVCGCREARARHRSYHPFCRPPRSAACRPATFVANLVVVRCVVFERHSWDTHTAGAGPTLSPPLWAPVSILVASGHANQRNLHMKHLLYRRRISQLVPYRAC